MTSSLVGSEMCIRDRRPSPLRAALRLRLRPTSRAFTRPGPASAPLLRAAVSYTHLTLPTICSV
eukprot:3739117-Prorocentrum_lima.AAC.1